MTSAEDNLYIKLLLIKRRPEKKLFFFFFFSQSKPKLKLNNTAKFPCLPHKHWQQPVNTWTDVLLSKLCLKRFMAFMELGRGGGPHRNVGNGMERVWL